MSAFFKDYSKKGFTILEAILCAAIVGIVAVVVLTGFKSYQNGVSLGNAGYELAFFIRQAQNAALNVKDAGSTDYVGRYGAHIEIGDVATDEDSVVYFVDAVDDDRYTSPPKDDEGGEDDETSKDDESSKDDDGGKGDGGGLEQALFGIKRAFAVGQAPVYDVPLQQKNFRSPVKISKAVIIKSGGNATTRTSGTIDIIFTRPSTNPSAITFSDGITLLSNNQNVVFTITDGRDSKEVSINSFGNIQVMNVASGGGGETSTPI